MGYLSIVQFVRRRVKNEIAGLKNLGGVCGVSRASRFAKERVAACSGREENALVRRYRDIVFICRPGHAQTVFVSREELEDRVCSLVHSNTILPLSNSPS